MAISDWYMHSSKAYHGCILLKKVIVGVWAQQLFRLMPNLVLQVGKGLNCAGCCCSSPCCWESDLWYVGVGRNVDWLLHIVLLVVQVMARTALLLSLCRGTSFFEALGTLQKAISCFCGQISVSAV